ncbi:MAG: hypothetical protein QMD65_00870 [Patescibacteria group bacterium]|nr:hypothetical protein [Patescibacteria group bacterium]
MERKELIRTIYLYLFSLVGLVLVIIGLVRLVDLGLKIYVFPKADEAVVYPEYPMPKPVPVAEKQGEPTKEDLARYKADQEISQIKQKESERARTASNSIAMLIIGLPIFFYHWRSVQKDRKIKI